jgi:CelD/BcsL family acetyltransferase involved in cellulose biosynthesis
MPISAITGSDASSRTSGVEIRIIRSLAEFAALAEPWTTLLDAMAEAAEPFQTHGWLTAWAETYLEAAHELAVVTGWREGRLVLAWPLVIERTAGLRVLSWMGAPVGQYGDVLVLAGDDRMALLELGVEAIAALGADLLSLRKTRADVAVTPLLGRLHARLVSGAEAPCCDLGSACDWAAYEQRYSAKARKNRRRLARRLGETGEVRLATFGPGTAAETAIDKALAMKRDWLARTGRIGPALADSRFDAVFDALAGRLADGTGPTLSVTTLEVAGKLAAATISLGWKGRLLCHVVVHDAAFDKAGAGVLVMEETIRRALEAGYTTFDFLAPGDAYKLDWADRTVPVNDWAVPFTTLGRAYAVGYLAIVRPHLKRLANTAAGRLAGRTASRAA